MRRPSLLKNSSTGARNVGSRTWQEHHITQLPTEQQNAWCRLSSKHWESLLYPRNVLFRNSWCSIGERRHPVVSLRVNCWTPGSYGQGSTRCCHRPHTLHKAGNPRRLQSLRWLQTREVSPRLPVSTRPEILCMRCTMDLAETNILVGYLRSSRRHWVLAASTSRSFLMAQFGDDTGSSCSHATLLMRTTNLVMLWTTFLNCRRIVPWTYRGLHHRFRDIPGPRLYHLSQSMDRTIPDDRKGHVNPTKDIVVDA